MKMRGAIETADRVIRMAEEFGANNSNGVSMSFSTKYGKSAESLKWLAGSLRDLTVNIADHLKIPVDSLRISYGSAQHGFTWEWALEHQPEDASCLTVLGPDLNDAVEDLGKQLLDMKARG